MKLLQKTQRLYLQFALPIFLLAGIGMYLLLTHFVYDFSDENLHEAKTTIEKYVNTHDTLPVFFQTNTNYIDHWPSTKKNQPERIFDTLLYNNAEAELEPFRRLEFSINLNGQAHRIAINQSRLENEELALGAGLLLALLFLVLFGLLLWTNRRISKQVWEPFFATLNQLRAFKLSGKTTLQLENTPVAEFQELHHSLQHLTAKVRADFQTVQQFTENASHEMQTPLAVIQNELDLLFQQVQMTETQAQHLERIGQQTRRLSKLNQALLLLAKIENNQFPKKQAVGLMPLLEKKLAGMEDFIAAKKLVVETELQSVHVNINANLAEMLLSNLLGNAVKHNLDGGVLHVALSESALLIRNSCAAPAKPVAQLIERFNRGNQQTEGLGLGLGIAREICDKSGLTLSVKYADGAWSALVAW